jgi:hypothetical protein
LRTRISQIEPSVQEMRILALSMALVCALTNPSLAQEREIRARGCATCKVGAQHRLVLDVKGSPGISITPLQVQRDRHGRYLVTTQGQLPLVFAPNGRFIREVGRRGSGPGELKSPVYIALLPGDSMLVLDTQLSRASVFSPDFKFKRSITLPFYVNAAIPLTWPGRVIANGVSYASQEVGWPLHLLDMSTSAAKRVASFGDNKGELRPNQNAALLRRIVGVQHDSFWAMHVLNYQITQHGSDGHILDSVRRRPDWFSTESQWSLGGPRRPPSPALQTAAVRGDTLWVIARVPKSDWEKAWAGVAAGRVSEVGAGKAPDPTQLHMSRVEVIDLRRGAVLAHADYEGIIVNIDADLRAIIYDLEEGGEPRLRIFQFRLIK